MQRTEWARTIRLFAIGLGLVVGGCDSSKTGTSSTTPETGGAKGSIGGATARGGASAGGDATTAGGTDATAGKPGSTGGANAGGRSTANVAGSSGSPAACTSNADCANSTGTQKLCSLPTNQCVECLTVADCAPGGAGTAGAAGAAGAPNTANLGCVKNTCTAYTPCVNSLGCATGQVCDTVLGRCAECTKDADCPTGSRCGQNQCRSGCTSDKDCTPQGMLCNATAGYCVNCNSTADCATNQFCSGGECLRDVCVANSTRCQNNGISTCFADGSGWSAPVACSSGRTCQSSATGAAVCQAWVCTPSTTACSTTEEKVITCSADGMTATTVTDCGAKSQVCASGACAAVVCTPSQRFCQAGVVRTCSVKGDTSTVYSTCTTAQYCDATTATCKALVCTPNQPGCNGNVATTCNADGSAWVTGGTDCTAGSSGQVCNTSTGTCQSQLCTPSTYFCDSSSAPNRVMLCGSTGLTSSVSTTCTSSQFCDSSTTIPTCKALLCNPSAPACNGNVATTCNSLGSGYATGGTDCTTTSKICAAGTCQNLACTPSSYFCDTTPGAPPALRYCAATGLTSTIYSSNTSAYYCNVTTPTTTLPTSPFTAKTCTPGQPVCSGNTATTCNSLGSGYVTGGTDCSASSTYCLFGACQATSTCGVTGYVCNNGAATQSVQYCSAGSTPYAYSNCAANQYCNATSATTASCTAKTCTPGQPVCNGNVATVCNSLGTGYATGGTDCLTATCVAGSCGTFTVDTTYTPTATSYGYSTYGTKINYYTVTTTRKVTLIEHSLYTIPADTRFVWTVYEASTQVGTYAPIWQGITMPTATTGWISSGPISNLTLRAGYYYAVALTWSSSSSVYYQLNYGSTYFPVTMPSFGSLTAGNSTTGSTAPATLTYAASYYYEMPQRFTTSAP